MKRERTFVETFLVFDSVFFGEGEGVNCGGNELVRMDIELK